MSTIIVGTVGGRPNRIAALALPLLAALLLVSGCGQTDFSASERLQRAAAFQAEGDLRASIIELKNLLQNEPQHTEGRWRLGLAYLELGDGAAALSALERGLALGWESPDAPLQLARARLLEREFDAVLEQLQTWQLTGDERLTEAHVLRAQAYMGQNNAGEAERELRAALKVTPAHAPALTGLARINLFHERLDEAQIAWRRRWITSPIMPMPGIFSGRFTVHRVDWKRPKRHSPAWWRWLMHLIQAITSVH